MVDVFDVIGVKKGDDGLPYALFAQEGVRVGAAIVSLPHHRWARAQSQAK